MNLLHWSELDPTKRRALLSRPALSGAEEARERTQQIVADVRARGDEAVRKWTAAIDEVELDALEVDRDEMRAARAALTAEQVAAIERAAQNIDRFHRAQLPIRVDIETTPGVRCERVYRPIGSVGLYVPAGTAPLPSTALMLGVPARIAGCPLRSICTPPRADGSVDPAVLVAADIAGIDRIFRIGGAQAIAAMAYGTRSVPKANKIFGPGNRWVTEAKSLVAADPAGAALDYPAGPSEVMVIADASADPAFVASDLLSQAEHGPDSQSILLTTSRELAAAVDTSISELRDGLSRNDVLDVSLRQCALIVVESIAHAIELANDYAPEHLILQVSSPRRYLEDVATAGSVFLGPWSPESIGDYCSGTNHVLPTYGYARAYSSLGVGDFLRSMTVQELSADGIRSLGPVAATLADLEGLDAHGLAVRLRLDKLAGGAA